MTTTPPGLEKPTRIRRTAAEARAAILDAAEARLVTSGPAGIRLQDVASDVGVSHPTVLHHFGSRDNLVAAVVQRRIDGMRDDVIAAFAATSAGEPAALALFDRLFAVFGPGGHARVLAYRALSGLPGMTPESVMPIVDVAHAARLATLSPGAVMPTLEDTHFSVLLGAVGLFGEAIAGPLFRGEHESEPDTATSERFRHWLARLIYRHLEGGSSDPSSS